MITRSNTYNKRSYDIRISILTALYNITYVNDKIDYITINNFLKTVLINKYYLFKYEKKLYDKICQFINLLLKNKDINKYISYYCIKIIYTYY